jgi:hypothetical protein
LTLLSGGSMFTELVCGHGLQQIMCCPLCKLVICDVFTKPTLTNWRLNIRVFHDHTLDRWPTTCLHWRSILQVWRELFNLSIQVLFIVEYGNQALTTSTTRLQQDFFGLTVTDLVSTAFGNCTSYLQPVYSYECSIWDPRKVDPTDFQRFQDDKYLPYEDINNFIRGWIFILKVHNPIIEQYKCLDHYRGKRVGININNASTSSLPVSPDLQCQWFHGQVLQKQAYRRRDLSICPQFPVVQTPYWPDYCSKSLTPKIEHSIHLWKLNDSSMFICCSASWKSSSIQQGGQKTWGIFHNMEE